MVISSSVQQELSQVTTTPAEVPESTQIPTPLVLNHGITYAYEPDTRVQNRGKAWSVEEHNKFLQAVKIYPRGPWKKIAEYIGTKTARQAMTHSQKCREKIVRRQRALEQQHAHLQMFGGHRTHMALISPFLPEHPSMPPQTSFSQYQPPPTPSEAMPQSLASTTPHNDSLYAELLMLFAPPSDENQNAEPAARAHPSPCETNQ